MPPTEPFDQRAWSHERWPKPNTNGNDVYVTLDTGARAAVQDAPMGRVRCTAYAPSSRIAISRMLASGNGL